MENLLVQIDEKCSQWYFINSPREERETFVIFCNDEQMNQIRTEIANRIMTSGLVISPKDINELPSFTIMNTFYGSLEFVEKKGIDNIEIYKKI